MATGIDRQAQALLLHRQLAGKLDIVPRHAVLTANDLALLYTPGVAAAAQAIAISPSEVFALTGRRNTIAVLSDGSAVLGLGNLGPEAALPVMEGKAVLFKAFAGVNAVPLCVEEHSVAGLAALCRSLAPSFGGINLEDIAAPVCFALEHELHGTLGIPFFHDDQHGTAIVVGAGLSNALTVTGRCLEQARIVINGIGAAGSAIARFLLDRGARHLRLCDRNGLLNPFDPDSLPSSHHHALAALTNVEGVSGTLADALADADVFIGVSRGDVLTPEMVAKMAPQAIVFALANPQPEIAPELAHAAGAAVVATGRSDLPNQINNVLAFPGVFRGTLDVEATTINAAMQAAAAQALADCISVPTADCIIPSPLAPEVAFRVAFATAKAAIASGVAGRLVPDDQTLQEAIRAHLPVRHALPA